MQGVAHVRAEVVADSKACTCSLRQVGLSRQGIGVGNAAFRYLWQGASAMRLWEWLKQSKMFELPQMRWCVCGHLHLPWPCGAGRFRSFSFMPTFLPQTAIFVHPCLMRFRQGALTACPL